MGLKGDDLWDVEAVIVRMGLLVVTHLYPFVWSSAVQSYGMAWCEFRFGISNCNPRSLAYTIEHRL
jgi:hypothetical protein